MAENHLDDDWMAAEVARGEAKKRKRRRAAVTIRVVPRDGSSTFHGTIGTDVKTTGSLVTITTVGGGGSGGAGSHVKPG